VLGGRFGEVPTALSFRLLDEFRAAGGRMLETAHVYASGEAERLLGAWLRSRRCRDEMTVIDKVGHPAPGDAPCLRAETIRREVASSLYRLATDRLDVLLLHRDDPRVPVESVLDILLALSAAGRVGRFGVSTGQPSGWQRSSTVLVGTASSRWSAINSALLCRLGRSGLVRGTLVTTSLTS